MKVKLIRSPGSTLLKSLECDREDLLEGKICDVDQSLADELIKRNLAAPIAVRGEAKQPEITAPAK